MTDTEMADDDGLLTEMVNTVMATLADGFREIWARPAARGYLKAFLDRWVTSVITCDGLRPGGRRRPGGAPGRTRSSFSGSSLSASLSRCR